MKKRIISFILVFMLAIMNISSIAHAERVPAKKPCLNASVIKLKDPMQKLWIEHAWWTRSYIISNLGGLKDQDEVLKRLLKNQEDIGNLIKPYYGVEAGNKLTELLKEHIIIAGKIVNAAKKGDQTTLGQLNKEWYRNADIIVDFLTKANPNWDKKMLTDMFYEHLKLTTNEVVDRLKENWVDDIKNADMNETHLIHFGDILTNGIIKQFPKKFK